MVAKTSAGGLGLGVGGRSGKSPNRSDHPYDLAGSNQPFGKGKIPTGDSQSTGHGAALTAVTKKVGTGSTLKLGVGSAGSAKSPRSAGGLGKSSSNSTKGSTAMSKNILAKATGDKFSTSAGTATPMRKGASFGKAPKQPKATGVGIIAPATNWHKKLGFS